MNQNDPVRSPSHYAGIAKCSDCGKPVECWDVVQHMSFPLGSAVKYIVRADKKGNPIQDLEKAIECLRREVEKRKGGAK